MSGTHQRYSIIRWWQVYGTGSSLGSGRFVFGLILVVSLVRGQQVPACRRWWRKLLLHLLDLTLISSIKLRLSVLTSVIGSD